MKNTFSDMFFFPLTAAHVLQALEMEKYLRDTHENSFKSGKAPSCSLVSVGEEANDIPPPQACFHLESLGCRPLSPLLVQQFMNSCCL